MKDLTQGPIPSHVVSLSIPIAMGMLLQTLYYFVDLYFVARLGEAPLAGVSAAGNVMFLVFALTQALGVGAVSLVSHAAGRKDQAGANLELRGQVLPDPTPYLSRRPTCQSLLVVLGFLASSRPGFTIQAE